MGLESRREGLGPATMGGETPYPPPEESIGWRLATSIAPDNGQGGPLGKAKIPGGGRGQVIGGGPQTWQGEAWGLRRP